MYKELAKLTVYSDVTGESILSHMGQLFKMADNIENIFNDEKLQIMANSIVKEILETSTTYAFEDNLWQSYLTHYIIDNENSFSKTCERTGAGSGSINMIVKGDFEVLMNLFNYDFTAIEEKLGRKVFTMLTEYKTIKKPELMYNGNVSDAVKLLKGRLQEAKDVDSFFNEVADFYKAYGAGIFGINRAFRITDNEEELEFVPVKNIDDVHLSDLVGYEVQKGKLLENTKAFVAGKPANNVLLFGDRGTGKSTSIKAIANEFWPDGLRIIQVYRHQMRMLSRIISRIRTRNYRFIIYMDDLSFEEFETEYKYLKAVIEGGLESKPENILIYATSNRRHLIKETWDDRSDMQHTGEMHRGDSMEEKLSLADRFGVQIYFGRPSKDEYDLIIEELAKAEGIKMDPQELAKRANAWQVRHGDRSGRCARQFIDHIKGLED